MQTLGYTADAKGVCFGYGHMGMQAILSDGALSDGMRAFDQRIENMMEDQNNMAQGDAGLTVKERGEFGISPFLDGVELYYQAFRYPELFAQGAQPKGQDALATAHLVMSTEIRNQDGLNKCADFSGIYDDKELTQYFATLQDSLTNCDPPNYKPIAMSLGNGEHSITVGFDPEREDPWIFIDANRIPTEYFKTPAEIAAAVQKGFGASEDKTVVFSTKIYSTNKNKDVFKPIIENWQVTDSFKALHNVNKESENINKENLTTWLRLAVKNGNVEATKGLLERSGVNPNQTTKNGVFPLYEAGYLGRIEVLKELLKHPNINPNQVLSDGTSTFQNARQNIEVVKELLKHPRLMVNKNLINEQDAKGYSLLHIAVMRGDVELVKDLLKHGANPALESLDGQTPGAMAVFAGNDAILDEIGDHFDRNPHLRETSSKPKESTNPPTFGSMFDRHKDKAQQNPPTEKGFDEVAKSPRIGK